MTPPATPTPDRASAPPRLRVLRALAWTLAVAGAVLVVALVAGFAWLRTGSALEFALAELTGRSEGRLVVEGATGSLTSSVAAKRIVYRTAALDIVAEDVTLAWTPAALWSSELRVDTIGARRVVLTLNGSDAATGLPASLALPLEVAIGHAGVGTLEVVSGPTTRRIDGIAFSYRGGRTAHTFADLVLGSAAGRLQGEVAVGASPPFGIRGAFALRGAGALAQATANVTLGGRLEALDVRAALRVGAATGTASATLAPLAPAPLRALAVAAQGIDAAAFAAGAPRTALDATLDAAQRDDGSLGGRVSLLNREPGTLAAARMPVRRLDADFRWRDDTLELSALAADLGAGGRATGTARATFGATPSLSGRLALAAIDLAALHPGFVATQLAGTLRADVDAAGGRYEGDVGQRGMALAFAARVAADVVTVERFRARADGGEIAGRATYAFAGQQPFTVDATATHLDPSRFGAWPAATLDGTLAVTGALAPAWSAGVALALAPTARLAGTAVGGTVKATLAAHSIRAVAVELSYGSARLTANGDLGSPGDRLDYRLDVPQLAALAPLAGARAPAGLAGRLAARGRIEGTFAAPGVTIDASGDGIVAGPVALRAFTLAGAIGGGPAPLAERAVHIAAAATSITLPAGSYATASVAIDGTLARHQATLGVTGEDLDATARLAGGFDPAAAGASWSGTLAAFENRGAYAVRLLAPAPVALARDRVAVAGARFAVADGMLTANSLTWQDGRIATHGAFAGVPLATLARLAGVHLPLRSTLVLGGEWDVDATPRLSGRLAVRRERGDLYAGTGTVDGGDIAFGLEAATLDVDLVDDALAATLAVDAARLGSLRGSARVGRGADATPGRIAASAPLDAHLTADIASLAPLQPLLGTGALADGRVHLDLAARGTLARAPVSGTLRADGLRLDAAQYGVHWHDGKLAATLAEDAVTLDEFAFAAGDGRFTASGTLPAAGAAADGLAALERGTRITWHAERFRATNRPDLRFVVSGDGTLGVQNHRLALAGKLTVDEGAYEFEPARGATLSADVVVKGRPPPAEAQRFARVPVAVAIDLDLGGALVLRAQGLETGLAGNVRIAATPGGPLTGTGTIRAVNGTYYAFGQRLVIDRGRVIFDGPLDNPALDIVALRKNLAVEAGVEVTGTVRVPLVRLTSDPPVPDGEKLSWLVLGQGLDRSSGADAAALQAAAASLFGPGNAPIGTTLARKIGLDDIAVRSAASSGIGPTGAGAGAGVGGQVVAVGKRLSDKLYLVYEQGLTVATNALKLEYSLTRDVTLRAEAGVVSGFGIYYRRSFD